MWWYRKEAVFYVPRGWYGPAEWLLALPSAPRGEAGLVSWSSRLAHALLGAVSCTTWQMACQRTIKAVERVVRDLSLQRECLKASVPIQVQNSFRSLVGARYENEDGMNIFHALIHLCPHLYIPNKQSTILVHRYKVLTGVSSLMIAI